MEERIKSRSRVKKEKMKKAHEQRNLSLPVWSPKANEKSKEKQREGE